MAPHHHCCRRLFVFETMLGAIFSKAPLIIVPNSHIILYKVIHLVAPGNIMSTMYTTVVCILVQFLLSSVVRYTTTVYNDEKGDVCGLLL